jgi:hypothetical protein
MSLGRMTQRGFCYHEIAFKISSNLPVTIILRSLPYTLSLGIRRIYVARISPEALVIGLPKFPVLYQYVPVSDEEFLI